MKICTICGIEKPESEFYKSKRNKEGLNPHCKTCHNNINKKWRESHTDEVADRKLKWSNANKDRVKVQTRNWYRIHRAEQNAKCKLRRKLNHLKINEYERNRKKNNPLLKLTCNLRTLIGMCFKKNGYSKKSKTQELLGCTFEEFYAYLGPKPEGRISVEHICPYAQAQNEVELIKLQHHTNLKWMLLSENCRKNDNKTPEAEEMCRQLLGREWIE